MIEHTMSLLNTAIDNHSLLNKNQKNVLRALIKLSLDYEVVASIKDLNQLTGVTNTTIASALSFLEKNKIIENLIRRGVIFTGCSINKSKLDEIVIRYNTKKDLLEKN